MAFVQVQVVAIQLTSETLVSGTKPPSSLPDFWLSWSSRPPGTGNKSPKLLQALAEIHAGTKRQVTTGHLDSISRTRYFRIRLNNKINTAAILGSEGAYET